MLSKAFESNSSKVAPTLLVPASREASSVMRRPVHVDKIGSVGCRANLGDELWVSLATLIPKAGDLVVAKVLSDNKVYNRLELSSGRLARLNPGDLLVGAVGARRALKGYVGEIPSELAVGDEFHLLNMGGVVGRCTGFHHEMGPPIRLEYVGAVHRDGQVLNMAHFGLPHIATLNAGIPVIAVAGSCMHSGKTRAASELVRQFSEKGYRVAAGKLSGVACLKDSLEMRDNGAIKTLCFIDLGLASTVGIEDLGLVARTIIGHLSSTGADLVIVELGDGILGGYNVGSILDDPLIRAQLASLIYCANDFVSAWGGVELLKQKGITPDVICGSVTDSRMGVDFIRQKLSLPAANAMIQGPSLCSIVESRLISWRQNWQQM